MTVAKLRVLCERRFSVPVVCQVSFLAMYRKSECTVSLLLCCTRDGSEQTTTKCLPAMMTVAKLRVLRERLFSVPVGCQACPIVMPAKSISCLAGWEQVPFVVPIFKSGPAHPHGAELP